MKYIEFKVHASRQGIEQVTALLMSEGVDSVSIDDPEDIEDVFSKEHQYDWDYVDDSIKEELEREPSISAYFEDTEENREKVQQLKIAVMMLKSRELEGAYGWDADFGRLYAEDIYVNDEDWKDKWKEFFKPSRITDRLVVKPTWEEYSPSGEELVIELDPGMAFGTGTHETTALCMRLIEKYLGDNPESRKLLDIGCGSGILSIGAALLGCGEILAVDIDEDAVRTAAENVEKNGLENKIKVIKGDLAEGVDFKGDIIAANLMADLVIRLASSAAAHLNEGGIFISSGILMEKKDKVEEAISSCGFSIKEVVCDGEWCAITAEADDNKRRSGER